VKYDEIIEFAISEVQRQACAIRIPLGH
jgi:hypothetical protein